MLVPSNFFDLPKGVVHVLCLNLADHVDWLGAALPALDPAEQARASRFKDAWHGRRYANARGLLRTLLGHFSGCSPSDIVFSYGLYGKPRMNGFAALDFSVSHCGDWTAFGFSRGRRIGIDLENVAVCHDTPAVASQCFSSRELTVLAQEMNTEQAFCAIWVRKEAVLKAAGLGLGSLREFCSFDPVVQLRDEEGTRIQLCLSEIAMPAGFNMALAAEGGPVRSVIFRL